MTDSGNGDDLWANTRPDGTPHPDPALPDPDITPVAGIPPVGGPPTVPMPPAGGDGVPPADPTTVLPVVPGGAGIGPPPPAPPGGGGPPLGGGGPPFGDDDGTGAPPWLLPAAAAMVVLLLIGLIVVIASSGGDDDTTTTSTLPSTETTLEPILTTTSGPDTTLAPDTTAETTSVPESTTTAETTTTTLPPTTTTSTTTTTTTTSTTTTTTTVAPNPLPAAGSARVDGQVVPIEAACSVVSFAPANTNRQNTGFLMTTTAGRVQIDRWVDGSQSGVDLLFIDSGQKAASTSVTPTGSGFVATMRDSRGDFEVALNPPSVSPCAKLVRSSPTDLQQTPYNQGVLDFCTLRAGNELVFVAILTEQGRVLIVDLEDGTADIDFTRLTGEGHFIGAGTSAGGVYDATLNGQGTTILFNADLNIASPRQCANDELF